LKLRFLDATKETLIVPDVLKIDTAREPSSVVARNLNDIVRNGIWLSPYRGIPKVEKIPDLDIVYIDPDFRVLRCFEGYRQGSMMLPDVSASSALVLPSGRVSEARIQRGDKLELRDAATGSQWHGGDKGLDRVVSPREAPESSNDDLRPLPKPQSTGLWSVLGRLIGSKEEPKRSDRRKAERHAIPGLVAYFSLTRLRERFGVKSISTEGFYVLTEERWPVGTSIMVGLQIVNPVSHQVEATISVQSKVIWAGTDGVGFAFDDDPAHRNRHLTVKSVEEWQQLEKFIQMIKH